MASIRKHRDKYQVRVRRQGYPEQSRSFSKLTDAKEWANEIERQADRRDLSPSRKELNTLKLADIVIRYRNEVVPKKRHGDTDTFALNLFLRHSICKKTLSALTPSDFVAYQDERLKVVSPSTLKRQFSPLKHMIGYAREEWDIPLPLNLMVRVKFKDADRRRERRLRDGELDKIAEAAKATRNPLVLPIIYFALETAMRRGEMLALQWSDIDVERQSATIRESKNGYSRTIPLSSKAIAILRDLTSDDQPKRDALIFPMAANALRLSWERLVRRADIEDLHFHDIRHEAISRLFELGLTVPEVASISGHRDMRMLFRYAHANHASISAKLEAAAK